MRPRDFDWDAIDLSPLDATGEPLSRDALVAAVMSRYVVTAPLDLWTAIAVHTRAAGVLAAAALISALGSLAVTHRPAAPPALLANAGVPAPFAEWAARPSMPSPLEVMVAMAEIPR
jgi:hypothetical protein